MNIVIACGGTGGHLFPGLAVAETLLARGHRVRLLVSEKAVDKTALAGMAGMGEFSVKPIRMVGYAGPKQFMRFCGRLVQATQSCAADYAEFGADAVLGMGGFTSAPAVLAARLRRVPAVVHESNAVPGKANQLAGRFARHVALGMAECATHFQGRPVTVTGTPLRKALRGGRVPNARSQLGLAPDKLTVLVMGGSQGAHSVNETMACALAWLEDWRDRVQFFHLSGAQDEALVRKAYAQQRFRAVVCGFCDQMQLAYSAADLVISRAGAATLSELAAFGLPALLIPYAAAAGNHQAVNARVFQQAGAGQVLEESQLPAVAGKRLGESIVAFLADSAGRERMAAAARRLVVPDAEQRIADLLEEAGRR